MQRLTEIGGTALHPIEKGGIMKRGYRRGLYLSAPFLTHLQHLLLHILQGMAVHLGEGGMGRGTELHQLAREILLFIIYDPEVEQFEQ